MEWGKQGWYKVWLTVRGEHDLSFVKKCFYLVTKRGRNLRLVFSGKRNRKSVSLSDPKILGHITKGALINSEVFYEIIFTKNDPKKKRNNCKRSFGGVWWFRGYIEKTNKTKEDRRGNKRDVWLISFPQKLWKPDKEWYRLVNEIASKNKD